MGGSGRDDSLALNYSENVEADVPTILYSLVKERFITYLRSQTNTPNYEGTTGGDILNWYISEHAGDLEDMRQYLEPRALLKKVLNNMLEKEGVLIEVADTSSNSSS